MSEPPYAPSEPPYQPPPWAAPPPSTKKRKAWLIVVVVATIGLLLLIGGGLAITGSGIDAADKALSETSASLEPESSSPALNPLQVQRRAGRRHEASQDRPDFHLRGRAQSLSRFG